MDLRIKRAYEPPARGDGARILVDRLWPRGVTKDALELDLWLKDIAPSTALRKWYGHDPGKFAEFRRRYRAELAANPGAVAELEARAARRRVTLVYAARDPEIANVAVLRDYLLGRR